MYKVKDLIEMFRGVNHHHLHSQCKEHTLKSIDKLHKEFHQRTQNNKTVKDLRVVSIEPNSKTNQVFNLKP